MLISFKNTLTNTLRIIFDQIPGHPWFSQVDTKLTITAGMGETLTSSGEIGLGDSSVPFCSEMDQHLQ